MGALHSWLRRLLIGYLCLVLFGTGLMLAVAKLNHVKVLSVQTGSMTPTFKPGDAVLVRPNADIYVGEIVSYISPESGQIISHRVIALDTKLGHVTTRGDHELAPDTPIARSAITGRVVYMLPQFGSVLSFLRRPIGLTLFLYLPALAIVVSEIKRLADHYRRGFYRLFIYR